MNEAARAYAQAGQGETSDAPSHQPTELLVDPYVGKNGYVQNAGFVQQPIAALEKGDMLGPVAIVLHRTVSTTASSPLNSFASGTGTHFLIDKDGTTYQTASLYKYTWHVGPIRSRCLAEGTCAADEATILRKMKPTPMHAHERAKDYPDRYPMNQDSVGIEVVAMYHESSKTWDEPTAEQSSSIHQLIQILKKVYSLQDADIYAHDLISRKTEGEGQGLYPGHTGSLGDGVP